MKDIKNRVLSWGGVPSKNYLTNDSSNPYIHQSQFNTTFYSTVLDGAGPHNSVYRGKQFIGAPTDAQYNNISNGTFKDLFIGDYWTIDGINYRIAHFDYYLHCGNPTECTKHHTVIVPDTMINAHPWTKMNDANVTIGGYVGSKMYTTYLEPYRVNIRNKFKDSKNACRVMKYCVILTTAVVTNGDFGYSSNSAWCENRDVELMNEQVVYGSFIFTPGTTNSYIPYNYRIDKTQFALFAMCPDRICANGASIGRMWYWLRDVVSGLNFATVDHLGHAGYNWPINSGGIRPTFSIC